MDRWHLLDGTCWMAPVRPRSCTGARPAQQAEASPTGGPSIYRSIYRGPSMGGPPTGVSGSHKEASHNRHRFGAEHPAERGAIPKPATGIFSGTEGNIRPIGRNTKAVVDLGRWKHFIGRLRYRLKKALPILPRVKTARSRPAKAAELSIRRAAPHGPPKEFVSPSSPF